MRSIALGFICIAAIGCSDDQSASGVYPSSGFLGRTMRVEISGDNTQWNEGVTVDFGPGVTVKSVSAASSSAIFAEIEISDTASPGLRDVVINDGKQLALYNAFELTSPIAVDLKGTLAQGSVVEFSIRNLDLLSPFDDTCTQASFFGCQEYGNIAVEAPPGTTALIGSVSPFALSGTLYLNMDAAPGSIAVMSGAGDKALISPMGRQLEIASRTATPLNGTTTATVAAGYESHLYEVSTTDNSLSRFSISTDGAAPTIYLLPESGDFMDTLEAGPKPTLVTQTAAKVYAVVVDSSGDSGFSYTLRNQPLTLKPVAENDTAGANNAFANAQAIAMSSAILVTGASISAETDADWYKFTVPANSATKKVRVLTTGTDPMTDTNVQIYAGTNTNMIGEAEDQSYHENVTSEPIGAATTIYVKIFSDPRYYNPMHTSYIAAIWLE